MPSVRTHRHAPYHTVIQYVQSNILQVHRADTSSDCLQMINTFASHWRNWHIQIRVYSCECCCGYSTIYRRVCRKECAIIWRNCVSVQSWWRWSCIYLLFSESLTHVLDFLSSTVDVAIHFFIVLFCLFLFIFESMKHSSTDNSFDKNSCVNTHIIHTNKLRVEISKCISFRCCVVYLFHRQTLLETSRVHIIQ